MITLGTGCSSCNIDRAGIGEFSSVTTLSAGFVVVDCGVEATDMIASECCGVANCDGC